MAKREKFTTLTSLHLAKYGGNESHSLQPDPDRCCKQVTTYIGRRPKWSQCNRPRGHGPEQAYCKQHAPETVARRREESRANADAHWRQRILELRGSMFFGVLCQIADGHNDPRALAAEAIKGLREP